VRVRYVAYMVWDRGHDAMRKGRICDVLYSEKQSEADEKNIYQKQIERASDFAAERFFFVFLVPQNFRSAKIVLTAAEHLEPNSHGIFATAYSSCIIGRTKTLNTTSVSRGILVPGKNEMVIILLHRDTARISYSQPTCKLITYIIRI